MKTIADFKRKMVVGSKWHTTHRYIGENSTEPKDLGIRECRLVKSNCFALGKIDVMPGEIARPSYCDWPKKDEFKATEIQVTIRKEGFCELIYTLIEE